MSKVRKEKYILRERWSRNEEVRGRKEGNRGRERDKIAKESLKTEHLKKEGGSERVRRDALLLRFVLGLLLKVRTENET